MLRRRTKQSASRAKRSRTFRLERLESRQLLAADSIGVTPRDTGEFLLGTVAVTPVLFESNGGIDSQTQNWSTEEIDQVLAKVSEGVNWWRDTLATLTTAHELEFVIDETFASDPFETGYEPIDRPSTDFNLYVGEFIIAQGYGDANTIEEGVQRFNHDQRERLGTDWAFTIFLVDSSDDADGLFASGLSFAAAFAYAGGLFIVSPSTRPASTITHEMGHIFWARDEYPGGGTWSDRRGYYDTQNLNAADNPTPGFEQEISIMRGGVPLTAAYEQNVSPASTLAMVGWQDSDGDGVFDVADVPLDLQGAGYFDAATSQYHFRAEASAVPLINRNSSGPQSDITLNRISQLQYRMDDGPWQVAAEPDAPVASFDLSIAINASFDSIEWRVIDVPTGITSPILAGSVELPAISRSSLAGLAFLDENDDGVRNPGEGVLANTEVTVRNADGSPLLRGSVDAAAFSDGPIPLQENGVSLSADGVVFDVGIGSFASSSLGGERLFHAFDQQRNRWIEHWSSKVAFQAHFDQPLGEVEFDAFGLGDGSFARIEAYDAAGELIARSTSSWIEAGQRRTVRVTDAEGRIASVRAFGHAGTSVAIGQLRYGSADRVVVDDSGVWQFHNLPAGSYLVELQPERVIHQFDSSSHQVSVVAGDSPLVMSSAERVNSTRHNGELAADVNGDGGISASDALVVINDLGRFSPRILGQDDPSQFDVDVNNDGAVSAIDALLVINALGQQEGGAGEWVAPALAVDSLAVDSLASELAGTGQSVDPWLGEVPVAMLNSAGHEFRGESVDVAFADSTGEHGLVTGPAGRQETLRGDFLVPSDGQPANGDEFFWPSAEQESDATTAAEDRVDPILPELREPFGDPMV